MCFLRLVISKYFKTVLYAHDLLGVGQTLNDRALSIHILIEESVFAVFFAQVFDTTWSLFQLFKRWCLDSILPVLEYEFKLSNLWVLYQDFRVVTEERSCNGQPILPTKTELVIGELIHVVLLQNDVVRALTQHEKLIRGKGKPYRGNHEACDASRARLVCEVAVWQVEVEMIALEVKLDERVQTRPPLLTPLALLLHSIL